VYLYSPLWRGTTVDTLYIAQNPELPGCKSQGRTPKEAIANLAAARIDFIYFLIEDGLPVPDPQG
jgi:predicted RNase H-like HicB family nuclease